MLHFFIIFILFETYQWATNSSVRTLQIPLLLLATTKRLTSRKSMILYATKKQVNSPSKKSLNSCTLPNKWLNRSLTTSTSRVKDKSISMSSCAQLHLCTKTMKKLNNFYLTFSKPTKKNSTNHRSKTFSILFSVT